MMMTESATQPLPHRLDLSSSSSGSSSSRQSFDAQRASLSVVRTAEDVAHARVTSMDHVALQFYWQGFDAYVHSKARESVAPCFFNAHCDGSESDGEFVHIVPVEEVRERSILDEMRVQLVSVSSGKYLRATRVSKFLRWSAARDEQTVFQIQVLDRKPLTQGAKFTLASCFWPGFSVGFAQKMPLGGSRELAKAIGFLTLEKKKHQPPLLFPVRFRAVLREHRDLRPASSPSQQQHAHSHSHAQSHSHHHPQQHDASVPTALVTASEMEFIEDEVQEELAERFPLATVMPLSPQPQQPPPQPQQFSAAVPSIAARPEDDAMSLGDACPYCSVVFRQRATLLAHIRNYHGDWLSRPSVAGSFCVHCGQRRVNGACSRCPP